MASAEVELIQAKSRLEGDALAERGAVAAIASALSDVRRRAEAYRAGSGEVFAALDVRKLGDREAELVTRLELAKGRVAVVERGKRGIYAADRLKNLSPQRVSRFFEERHEREGVMYEASPELKALITFKQLNLMHPFPMRGQSPSQIALPAKNVAAVVQRSCPPPK